MCNSSAPLVLQGGVLYRAGSCRQLRPLLSLLRRGASLLFHCVFAKQCLISGHIFSCLLYGVSDLRQPSVAH